MGIVIKQRGRFKNTDRFFKNALQLDYRKIVDRYGQRGVEALRSATPKDSGTTADSWSYVVEEKEKGKLSICFKNSNIVDGINIAIILNYGHGTSKGVYVAGRNYINPAIQPIFDEIADNIWKEVID